MGTGPHLLTVGEPSQATNPTETPTETQMMLLTGPETETGHNAGSYTSKTIKFITNIRNIANINPSHYGI